MQRRVYLVTGGAAGIGRAIAEHLLKQDHHVAVTYCSSADAADELRKAYPEQCQAFAIDLNNADAIEPLVERVEETLGSIDGLINNAGVTTTGLLAMTGDDTWARILDTNLNAAFRCCRAVLPGMLKRRRGNILNVASLSALRGVAGQSAYAASKAGLVGMTRSLAREVGKRNIRVNAIAPGFVQTTMTASLTEDQVKGLRQTECLPSGVTLTSVAETAGFLLSDLSASITGQCIVIDAGASI